MPAIRFVVVFLCAALCVDARSQSLPAGGGLDAARVVELRYGNASPGQANAGGAQDDAAREHVRDKAIPGALATLVFEDSGGKDQASVPVTFGQVFGVGALKRGERLQARLADGSTIPVQADIKARHPDGSVRHALVSLVLARLAPAKPVAVGLFGVAGASGAADADGKRSAETLLRKGFDARIEARFEGKTYSASVKPLLARSRTAPWLDGPVAQEWHASAPLTDADGRPHPHLAARFAVRWYPALDRARVDVTVENNWAFEPAPQNFTYDARITVGDAEVYSKPALEHYHHARWRKLSWWGDAPSVHVRHDTRQLIASMALPNYDQSVTVDETALARMHADWKGAKTEPMGTGQALRGMPTTGGRPDIGLLPGWAAMYLLGMDRRAHAVTMGTADLAGSWSMHYRDRRTDLPVSLLDYPYMTRVGTPSDARNPATGKSELFPACARPGACATPNQHDISHQPAFSYLPYLVTGDHYHLEELQFWAMYDVFASNPGYRENRKGLLKPEQVRGQAWALRTLGQAAYITPDAHPLKRHFLQILDDNLDWYNGTYTHNPRANALGIIVNGYALGYNEKRGIAPWQDDFFTSAAGHVAELGFGKARELLRWKAKFPVMRMIGDGTCWIHGAMYSMLVRDSDTASFYGTIGEAYRASIKPDMRALPCAGPEMAAALKLRTGEMTGYSSGHSGYPSNMQPALAYAADALGEPGRKAWQQFMARSVKPDYGAGPQFAIVPR
ncbi:RIFT barrel domain-containing protein [Massilia consociata]|uniref:PcRGLX/YetA-like N-terminal RIFT barrel domain-containing protein n=1 Tax=Massilia consociata TaxID=760117 RepID=A0ABV6FCB3_9BURK